MIDVQKCELAMQCFTGLMCTRLLTSGVGKGVGGAVVGLTEGLWVGKSVVGGSVLISTKTVGAFVVSKRGGVPFCEPPNVGEYEGKGVIGKLVDAGTRGRSAVGLVVLGGLAVGALVSVLKRGGVPFCDEPNVGEKEGEGVAAGTSGRSMVGLDELLHIVGAGDLLPLSDLGLLLPGFAGGLVSVVTRGL